MNSEIKNAIEEGQFLFLLGAGASLTSRNQSGDYLKSGKQLAKLLADKAILPYNNEDLSVVCGAVKKILGERFYNILEEEYKYCQPSDEYKQIAKFPWARIYTLNIDDALDKALGKNSQQKINIHNSNDKIIDRDQLFQKLDYVKLNGSVANLRNGLIFSISDYGKAAADMPLWYKELAEDYFKFTFLFIGTDLKEPLFYHQIERYRKATGSLEQRSFVITPCATEIEKSNLLSDYNILHIAGTMEHFTNWLVETFPTIPKPMDIAFKNKPELGRILSLEKVEEQNKYIETFEHVLHVSRKEFLTSVKYPTGKIREFYKGFKPNWLDIIDNVPAELDSSKEFYEKITKALKNDYHLVVLYGPAGSGKTTLLKQAALNLADNVSNRVYFIDYPVKNLRDIIVELESINKDKYIVFCDRLDIISSDIIEIMDTAIVKKGLIVGAESQTIWEARTKAKIGTFCNDRVSIIID